jgi:hypothetical protein
MHHGLLEARDGHRGNDPSGDAPANSRTGRCHGRCPDGTSRAAVGSHNSPLIACPVGWEMAGFACVCVEATPRGPFNDRMPVPNRDHSVRSRSSQVQPQRGQVDSRSQKKPSTYGNLWKPMVSLNRRSVVSRRRYPSTDAPRSTPLASLDTTSVTACILTAIPPAQTLHISVTVCLTRMPDATQSRTPPVVHYLHSQPALGTHPLRSGIRILLRAVALLGICSLPLPSHHPKHI